MNKIVYGNRVFTDHEIESGNLHLVTSLISDQLEANTLTAVVKSSDRTIANFERNAKLVLYRNDSQEGIFYVQSIDRIGGDRYKIFATSATGLLIEGQHMGGIYTGQTAKEIISDICGSVPFIVKTNLEGVKLYGWLPIASPRDNLSQVLFALGAALKTDLDGILRIAGLWDGVSGSADKNRMYEGGTVEYGAKVTQVVLTEHQYSMGGDERKLFEGTAQNGDIITFNAPMYDLKASGITIQASGANWARVSAGNGTLTGREYIHNTRLITRNVQTANTPNVKTVDKATLISLVNSEAAADRLVSFFKCKETINASVTYRGENTGNIVSTYHPFDQSAVNACLQSADITLSNTLKADEKSLVGFDPLQQNNTVLVDQHQVVTNSGTVTLPGNATQIRIVLIGGGDGGHPGENGQDGTAGTSSSASSSTDVAKESYGDPGNGSPGGKGGKGGTGGKVYQFNIRESGAVSFSISIGQGGTGGNAGGDTTVTFNGATYSSASGTQSSGGFLDITTNTVYAGTGNEGTFGVEGGKGGTVNHVNDPVGGSGQPGHSCLTSHGGEGGSGHKSWVNNKWIAVTGGGGGGGAAYNASGGKGGNGYRTDAGDGGTGADGTTPAAETRPGWGGTGGNGGGGGGGGGGTGATASNSSVFVNGGAGGKGGKGGTGGTGAPGCVIIYYGVKNPISAGVFLEKNGKQFLDKLVRRFIV